MSAREREMRCAEAGPLLVFYACDEVDAGERERIDAHLTACAACALQLEEERAMQALLSGAAQPADRLDPGGSLLWQCRSELAETLDDLAAPRLRAQWVPFGWVRRWMALRPAWSAVLLILVGLTMGTQVSLWFASRGANGGGAGSQAMNILAAPHFSDDDLAKMAVAGVNFAPATDADSTAGTLRLQVRTERPVEVTGNVDDADVRRILTYVVANGARFDPGVRLDCLDALRARTGDAEVRRALMAAARNDQNAAVRIKALEALQAAAANVAVRDTFVAALEHDANPGVRVEAVNLLISSLQGPGPTSELRQMRTLPPPEEIPMQPEAPALPEIATAPRSPRAPQAVTPVDPSVARVMRVLENLERRDPNRYVRLRSAAALRQIEARDEQ